MECTIADCSDLVGSLGFSSYFGNCETREKSCLSARHAFCDKEEDVPPGSKSINSSISGQSSHCVLGQCAAISNLKL